MKKPISETHLVDCMDFMRGLPDKFFDLVLADPPYGILSGAGNRLDKYGARHKNWDSQAPNAEYFVELRRVSKNQIVWGANHFWSGNLPNTANYVFWYKHQPVDNWAAGELAWTSFPGTARCFDYMCYGGVNQDAGRFHPTQKPVALYRWLLDNYAKPGDKIFDPNMGSQSSRIAAYDLGFDYWGTELDADYFAAGEARFARHIAQLKLFTPAASVPQPTQLTLTP